MSEDGDDLNCQSPKSDMLRSFPTTNGNSHKVINHLSLWTHEANHPSSDRDLSRYSPDSLTPTDCRSISNVSSLSENTMFYLDDRRFSECLASFRDDAPNNNDERKLKSTMTENLRYILHHFDYNVSRDAVECQQRPLSIVSKTARTAVSNSGGLVDSVNTLMQDGVSQNNEQTVLMTISSDFGEQLGSSTTREPSLTKRKNQVKVVDHNPFFQSIITNGQSVSKHQESLGRSPCNVNNCADCGDNATLSEFRADKNAVQEKWVNKETRGETDTHTDAFVELNNCYDLSLDNLSDHSDKMNDIQENDDFCSSYDNIETDENVAVKLNGCSHQVCCGADKNDIFDSSTSIYDRIDKYNGVAKRRKHISCTKELSRQGFYLPSYCIAKQPSNDIVQFELSTESENHSCSLQFDSTSRLLSSNSAASYPHSLRQDEILGVTEFPMSGVGFPPLCRCNDESRRFHVEVKTFDTMNQDNYTTENRDDGAELEIITDANSNSKQDDECTAAASATMSSAEKSSLKDSKISNDRTTVTTSSHNGASMSADMAVFMDVDGEVEISSFSHTVDRQLHLAPNCRTTYDASTDCFTENMSDLNSCLTDASRQKNSRRSGDRTTQLTTLNIGNDNVQSDQSLSGSRLTDNNDQSQRHSSTSARSSSFVMVDIDISDSRQQVPSTTNDEHRCRIEAMKKQLLNAKPVAPTSSPIDMIWNSETAGKLTPAARSRSSIWTPYDAVFFEETTAGPSATEDRMWRTKSLQTLPGKFTSTGIDDQSKNEDSGMKQDSSQAELSFDKSRSLSDLRRMPDNEPQLHVYEIGSIDSGLNNENKIDSQYSTAEAPLRPLPSEEFIRRSLERLNLPDWFLNSSCSLLRKKVADNEHKRANGTISRSLATSVGKPTMADWQPLTDTGSHASHPQSTLMTSSTMPTSGTTCKSSTVPVTAGAYQFDTTDRLQPRQTIHRESDCNGIRLSEVINPTGEVSSAECQNREHQRKRRASKTGENEQHRCPHGKKTLMKCSRCRHAALDTTLSPTHCHTEEINLAPPESTIETTTVSQAPTLDNGDNIFCYATPEQPTENHKPGKRRETTAFQKSSMQHKKQTPNDNKENELKLKASRRSLCSQEVAVMEETVNKNGQNDLSAVSLLSEERETLSILDVPPRSRRLRKVKCRTSPQDTAVCTDVSGRYASGRTFSKSLRSMRCTDSGFVNASCEDGDFLHSRNRTPPDVTVVVSSTSMDLEIHNTSVVVSGQNVAEEDDRRKEIKVRRRRRREQQSSCVNASSHATLADTNNDLLKANGDPSVIERDSLLTQRRSDKCDHAVMNDKPSYPADELMRILHGNEQREAVYGAGEKEARRRRRRKANILTSDCTEAPHSECLLNEQHDQHAGDLDDRLTSTSSVQQRRRRRIRNNNLSSRPDAELQRQEPDRLFTQKLTSNDERKSSIDNHSQSEYYASVLSKSSLRSELEHTTKPFFKDLYLTSSMEVNNRTTSYRQPAEGEWSTSRQHPHRRPRCVADTEGDSFPSDISTPEVMNTQLQLVQDGTQPKSTNYRSELSATEQKLCLSAAARRCRRVNRSQRSR